MPRFILALLALLFLSAPLYAQQTEKRIALVIGNAGYQAGALETVANDAGLIAQTLQASGFDVVGARDLDQDSLRRTFRDFLDKAAASGPDTVAFIYLAGYGVQLEGENYFVPVDARIARDADVAAEALRISDYLKPLAAMPLKARIVVLDTARANPFAKSGQPLAGGLALVEPDAGTLIAFNAAPGTVAANAPGPYSPYAKALAEMMREGGVPLNEVFDRVRLRVNENTRGAQVPWNASRLETPFVFFEQGPDAPPPAATPEQVAAVRTKPIRSLDARDAYLAALERDTLEGYQDFLDAYPRDPMAKRVLAILAARREAITWRRTRVADTPPAYWSYLQRYPRGPHAWDARRRLSEIAAALEPPPSFPVYAYDIAPPPPDEVVFVDRPVLVFDDPDFGFAPPPPPPVYFIAPTPVYFVTLAPPPPPFGVFLLPVPVFVPVPVWVRAPRYVAAPPNNIIFANVHNTVIVNNNNSVTVINQAGQHIAPAGVTGNGAAFHSVALPPSVAQKAAVIQNQSPQTRPGQPGAPPNQLQTRPLPGANGQTLPPVNGRPIGPGNPPNAGSKPVTQAPAASPNAPALNRAAPQTNIRPLPQTGNKPAVTAPASKQNQLQIQRPAQPVPQAQRPAQPPPQAQRPSQASPQIQRPAPPLPQVQRPIPPPPQVQRPVAPPQIQRPAPPPQVQRPAPPPQAQKPAPKCGAPGLPPCH